MRDFFLEGRDLPVESPQEGFYIRFLNEPPMEIRLWEVHAGVESEARQEAEEWVGIMVAGELDFTLGDARKNLFPTDVFRVSARTPFSFRVIGERAARAVLIKKS